VGGGKAVRMTDFQLKQGEHPKKRSEVWGMDGGRLGAEDKSVLFMKKGEIGGKEEEVEEYKEILNT